jgi:cytoskeletal protein CcmA (bactofilin family)
MILDLMPLVWVLVLFTLTFLVFSVPLWPAFMELERKDIVRPKIDGQDNGSAAYATALAGQATQMTSVIHAGEAVNIVSAARAIQVHPSCTFHWLDAPTIVFLDNTSICLENRTTTPASTLESATREKFKRIEGNWETNKRSEFYGDYLVTQDAILAEDSVVFGNIKAYGSVKLAKGAVVHGSIFAQKNIALSASSFVEGVISSGQEVCLYGGCVVGKIEQLVSVSAPYIVAHAGAIVHGSLQASVQGVSRS